MSLLGLLSLAGIITNNGIETNRQASASIYDAIVTAALSRFHHNATSCGRTLQHGNCDFVRRRIGNVLTLGVVPVLYSLLLGGAPPPGVDLGKTFADSVKRPSLALPVGETERGS